MQLILVGHETMTVVAAQRYIRSNMMLCYTVLNVCLFYIAVNELATSLDQYRSERADDKFVVVYWIKKHLTSINLYVHSELGDFNYFNPSLLFVNPPVSVRNISGTCIAWLYYCAPNSLGNHSQAWFQIVFCWKNKPKIDIPFQNILNLKHSKWFLWSFSLPRTQYDFYTHIWRKRVMCLIAIAPLNIFTIVGTGLVVNILWPSWKDNSGWAILGEPTADPTGNKTAVEWNWCIYSIHLFFIWTWGVMLYFLE